MVTATNVFAIPEIFKIVICNLSDALQQPILADEYTNSKKLSHTD
jgi:hypothetical protein